MDAFQAFVGKGFDRRKETERATESFKIHEQSDLHQAAFSGQLDTEKNANLQVYIKYICII